MPLVSDELNQGGKHKKVYVEKQDVALRLAQSVMDNKESEKGAAVKTHKRNPRIDRKHRVSAQEKLAQTKAMVKARLKEKIKARKDASRSESTKAQQTSSVSEEPIILARKRVAFV